MEPEAQIRNLRDFLMVYNRMTEICFQRCTSNFNYRSLTMDEERCADSCAGKLIRSNHRLMGTYVNLMPGMVQRRMAEMEKKNAELVTAEAEAADLGPAASPSTPSSTSTEVKLAAASEPLVPSSLSQAVNGVGLTRLTSGPILELSPVRHDQSTVTAAPSAAPSGPHLSR
ncbi:unnamed protein product [Oncorhynchus mykiss]|uniref:Tim10-like domain-containing protein n=1 Tax=Oncorhynchus mykiss TaxID=8022 RepID=A0A060YCL7_ONCMY|nr:unnamed protein product [Oncorhynchus mykiss]